MTYLLDTHALLWYLFNNDRLPSSTASIITNADELVVSVVSLWEIAIKQGIAKLDIELSPSGIAELCALDRIGIMHISPLHLDELRYLPMIHRDPFDRLIVAQARCHGYVIVTRDENIAKYEVGTIW